MTIQELKSRDRVFWLKDIPSAVALRGFIDEMEQAYYSKVLPYKEAKAFLGKVPLHDKHVSTHNSVRTLCRIVGYPVGGTWFGLPRLSGLYKVLSEEERTRYLELRSVYTSELLGLLSPSWFAFQAEITAKRPVKDSKEWFDYLLSVLETMYSYGYAGELVDRAFDFDVFGVSYRLWVKYSYGRVSQDSYPVLRISLGKKDSAGLYKQAFSLREVGLPVENDIIMFYNKWFIFNTGVLTVEEMDELKEDLEVLSESYKEVEL